MVERFFELKKHKTDLRTEVLAGITTFMTMAYIIFVNTEILGDAGMDKTALIAVTCIVSAFSTIAVGIFANAPIAMAPGMGLNAFFAYSLVLGGVCSWQQALGGVFISGVIFLILSVVGLRTHFVNGIPSSLVASISVGIGLFITFIGLQKLGVVVDSPATLVQAGPLTPKVLIGLAGFLVMIFLEIRGVKSAMLAGIGFATVLSILMGYTKMPSEYISFHTDVKQLALSLDIKGALQIGMIGPIFSLMFTDMFDSVGTLVGVTSEANMMDKDGKIRGIDRLLTLDASATIFGSIMGTSTTTAYVESVAGVEQGGRSGLTSVVTGLFFLLAMLFVPIVRVVPDYAIAPALIMVGMFMIKNVKRIDFGDMTQAMPSYIIIAMIALSYSISTGLAFGFISYTLLKIISGKIGDIKIVMWIITGLSLLFLYL